MLLTRYKFTPELSHVFCHVETDSFLDWKICNLLIVFPEDSSGVFRKSHFVSWNKLHCLTVGPSGNAALAENERRISHRFWIPFGRISIGGGFWETPWFWTYSCCFETVTNHSVWNCDASAELPITSGRPITDMNLKVLYKVMHKTPEYLTDNARQGFQIFIWENRGHALQQYLYTAVTAWRESLGAVWNFLRRYISVFEVQCEKRTPLLLRTALNFTRRTCSKCTKRQKRCWWSCSPATERIRNCGSSKTQTAQYSLVRICYNCPRTSDC